MIAQNNGKIIRVSGKIIKPMIGSGPIIFGRTVTGTKYLTYGASQARSSYYDDVPVINTGTEVQYCHSFDPTEPLGISRPVPVNWRGKTMATASAQWQGTGYGFEYYNLFTNSSSGAWSYYSYPRTISCLFKYWRDTVSPESLVTAAIPEANGYANVRLPNAPVLTAKMEGSNLRLTIKPNYYKDVEPDGDALEVYNGWTKRSARVGTTYDYYYYLTKTIDTTGMSSLPWYRFTTVFESNKSFYVYINNEIAGRFTSRGTQQIGYDSFGVGLRDLTYSEYHEDHRLSITEFFVADMDLTSKNRSLLNVGPQPGNDGLLPAAPLSFSA